jgi:hypothetical protein
MRTTLDIDDDVLQAAKELGLRQKKTAGKMLSELARRGLSGSHSRSGGSRKTAFLGFDPFPRRGSVVTNEVVNQIRAAEEPD